ncbi:flavin reductase family protein [Rhodovulum sulfidophilum]|uniref:flavin reductase family protein n=1 Tax=Rhodovulum sulfidophilum TaxID=35806 RepID=UPI001F442F16|nr:flavin reductase family protein [Rhodovulum sulfidophilum]MCE8442541.1 flavin reductase family protein [Rhodovulum sulfidophilum]MCE8471455.1 flavin reductase family protein [Rhodovulum sulfidophilum]
MTATAPAKTDQTTHAFREAMASLAATACVVTAADADERVGRTVTATLSLAVDPPSLLVSIAASARLSSLIRARGGFSFAMLQADQPTVAEAFAGKVPRDRRFEHGTWEAWPSGHPRLRGAMVAMDCSLAGEIETEDHVLFVGRPQAIDLAETRQPLVWHHRRFTTVRPL